LRTPPHNLNLNYRWFQFSVFHGECYRMPKTSHMYIFIIVVFVLFCIVPAHAVHLSLINHIWIEFFFYFPYII
jgi:hypothetical protein